MKKPLPRFSTITICPNCGRKFKAGRFRFRPRIECPACGLIIRYKDLGKSWRFYILLSICAIIILIPLLYAAEFLYGRIAWHQALLALAAAAILFIMFEMRVFAAIDAAQIRKLSDNKSGVTFSYGNIMILNKMVVYTKDICIAVARLESDYEKFFNDRATKDAITAHLLKISELAGKLTDDFKSSHADMEWDIVASIKDKTDPDHGSIDAESLWNIAVYIPELKKYCESIINSEGKI